MKLFMKILVTLILLFIINCESMTRRFVDNTTVKKTKKNIKSKGFVRTRPVEQLGALPMKRNYRTVYQVFGSSAPLRRSTGEVNLNKRNCYKLCSDRIPHKVTCKEVIASSQRNGALECICLKKGKGKSQSYAQDDYCYNKKGCYQKNMGGSCLN